MSISMQQFSAILISETFINPDDAPDLYSYSKLTCNLLLISDFSPLVLYTLGLKIDLYYHRHM